jgi:hypothetical protein
MSTITNKNKPGFNQNYSEYENSTLTEKIKVFMPETFYKKVKYLCERISEVEWSGILLYSIQGTFKDLKTFSITLEDIIPMNKGSQAYTEYSFNEKKRDSSGFEDRHIDYVMEKEEAFDWKIGLIHSHNFMSVFFSGTDWDELKENAKNHNFYLSLICNNKMDFTAKVGFIVTGEDERDINYNALDETGQHFPYLQKVKMTSKYEKFFNIDTEIVLPEIIEPEFDTFFHDAVDSIITKAKYKPTANSYGGNNTGFNRNHITQQDFNKGHKSLPTNHKPFTSPSLPKEEIDEHTLLEKFLINCITLASVDISGIDTIKKAITRERTRGSFLNKNEYLQKFLAFYFTHIQTYYPEDVDVEEITINAIELVLQPLSNIPQFNIVHDLIAILDDSLLGEEEEADLFEQDTFNIGL